MKPKQKSKAKSGVKPKGPRSPKIKTSQPPAHQNVKSYGMVTRLQTEGPDPALPVGSMSEELRLVYKLNSNENLLRH